VIFGAGSMAPAWGMAARARLTKMRQGAARAAAKAVRQGGWNLTVPANMSPLKGV